MILLLDTRLLLWAAGQPDRLSVAAGSLILADEHELMFSAASIWEITIKRGLGRNDFRVDPALLRRGLLENGAENSPSPAGMPWPRSDCRGCTGTPSIASSSHKPSRKAFFS